MSIKPLEKKNNFGLILKLTFLFTLVATGVILDRVFFNKIKDVPSVLGKSQELKKEVGNKDLLSESIKKTEEIGGQILGDSTNLVTDIVSKAASTASDLIYQNSIGKLVDQIDKLPQDQQERVREQICK